VANTLDPSEIIDQLKDEAQKALGSALGSKKLEPFRIGAAGNVPYNFRDTRDVTKFNPLTYSWIKNSLKKGVKPFEFAGGTSFTNLYLKAIKSISYSLSEGDQSTLSEAASNATQQQAAVQGKWIEAFGKLPDGTDAPIDNIVAKILTWSSTAGLTLAAYCVVPGL
jgi:hypothetical protein